ncbi:MAG: putative O-glycosylation ligase, exosortase A system-associated [Woeseiaceae bacterium]|nr:putative O-glycosylation ligase, exosortase A system-associated [Woeseiaceae bacterium]
MRDLLVSLLVFGALPWILMRPYVGVLVYTWLGLMNPHRLTYGFAFSFPFGTVVAIATIVSMLISGEKKRVPFTGTFWVWLLLIVWWNVTTVFALNPEDALQEWDRAMKIQLMVFVTMLLMIGKDRIHAFVWVMAVSIGFFGVKGGLFAILTGGHYLVMGPAYSFIAENNTLALALIMVLPLMRYLMVSSDNKYVRTGLLGAIILTTFSIVSSHSRGAFLAGGMILLFLIFKSRHKVRFLLAAGVLVPIVLLFMPDAYFERMGTISSYDQDLSAMGRINAWWFAFNLASDYPITGGGFRAFQDHLFLTYAPNPQDTHDAHSIYFEILGEQGFVGLALFLLLGFMALRSCSWVISATKARVDMEWATDLAAMLQVSLVGYATGGAFLGLAYYDLYYNLVAVVIVLQHHVREKLAQEESRPVVAPDEDGEDARPPGKGVRGLT